MSTISKSVSIISKVYSTSLTRDPLTISEESSSSSKEYFLYHQKNYFYSRSFLALTIERNSLSSKINLKLLNIRSFLFRLTFSLYASYKEILNSFYSSKKIIS